MNTDKDLVFGKAGDYLPEEPAPGQPITRQELPDVPVEDIIPYDKNPRRNDMAAEKIVASLREYGYVKVSVVVDENMVMLTGHTTLKAIRMLGWKTVPVVSQITGLTEPQKKAYRIADNRLGELSTWDPEVLLDEIDTIIKEGGSAEMTGFSTDEVDRMLENITLGDDISSDPALGNDSISLEFTIHFNTEPEAKAWYRWLSYLKGRHQGMKTDAERIVAEIQEARI